MAEIQYKTFDQLMSSVERSLKQYADANLIKRGDYIKDARYINKELGIKINRVVETEVEVQDYKAEIPEDLLSIIGAVAILEKDQKERFHPLTPTRVSIDRFAKHSYNRNCKKTEFQIDVDDNIFTLNFKYGKIYLVYVADLVDEKGNLLVLDHPLVNPYYESKITTQILKDLWYNSDADTHNKYQNERDIVLPQAAKKAKDVVYWSGYKALRAHALEVEKAYYNRFIRYV